MLIDWNDLKLTSLKVQNNQKSNKKYYNREKICFHQCLTQDNNLLSGSLFIQIKLFNIIIKESHTKLTAQTRSVTSHSFVRVLIMSTLVNFHKITTIWKCAIQAFSNKRTYFLFNTNHLIIHNLKEENSKCRQSNNLNK